MTYRDLPKTLSDAVYNIVQDIEAEERVFRPYLLRMYKQYELYWEGITDIYWDEASQNWLSIPRQFDENGTAFDDPIRNVNIYRAHGESIIAALGASVPIDKYAPEDPDNPNDIKTAKAYSAIGEIIQIHNDLPTLILRCLFILFNQGVLFGYTYSHRDRMYGVYQNPIMSIVEEEKEVASCPDCGSDISESTIPGEDDIVTGEILPDRYVCPECSIDEFAVKEPLFETITEPKLVVSDFEDIEKAKEIIEVWGGLNVHFPIQVDNQKSAGYLILETEQDYALMRSIYPDKANKITPGTGLVDPYEVWARRDPRVPVETNRNMVTVKRVWLRPWMFYRDCVSEELRDQLLEQFPNGAYCVFINDEYMEAHDENMDDHWTVSINPISRLVQSAPLGRPLLDIQDLTTNTINIMAQTIEYGIPQTFADPKFLNFDAYGKHRAKPGEVFPLKGLPAGGNADSIFHSEKAAVLGDGVEEFLDRLDSMGQFVSGDFPSIFGGSAEGGSKTLGEYEQSGARALQRLSLPWKMLTKWKSELMLKAVKEYAELLKEDGRDEYAVKPTSDNAYLKVWAQVSDLQGTIGRVIPESSDQFPTSWPQKVARFFEILNGQNPQLLSMLFIPQNASFIKQIIGIPELAIPGSDQRDKQLERIFELLKMEPLPPQPMLDPIGNPVRDKVTGQAMMGQPQPSIPVDAEVDDPFVNVAVTKQFLISEFGRALKITNPAGYQNVIADLRANNQLAQQQMIQQQQQMANGQPENAQEEESVQ